MTAWAIWYGDLLDGVTTSTETADAAREAGATVIPMELRSGLIRWRDIPRPEATGLPLGWHESEVAM